MCLFELWLSRSICLVVGLLGHMVVLFLVFKGISILLSIVALSIYTTAQGDSLFSTLPSAFIVCGFLMMAIQTHVRWYLIVVLIFISLIINVWAFFSCVCWPSVCLVCLEKVFQFFLVLKNKLANPLAYCLKIWREVHENSHPVGLRESGRDFQVLSPCVMIPCFIRWRWSPGQSLVLNISGK